MTVVHEILGGEAQVFRRPNSPYWQCRASIGGYQHRATTREEGLAEAKDFAKRWYVDLQGKDRWGGGVAKGKTFRKAAEKFLDEFQVLAGGDRSPRYVRLLRQKIDKHLNPFFGDKPVTVIDEGLVQDYRVERAKTKDKDGQPKPPARTTVLHEIQALRHVLTTAKRHHWLEHLPDLSAPYKASGKITHRAWFSLDEYTQLYQATRKRAKHPPHPKWKWECEQFHDYVLFMANTGLRPDEAARLEFRDVVIVDDDSTGERILEIEVRGKRGVGYCKSMPRAVRPFERLCARERTSRAEILEITEEISKKIAEEDAPTEAPLERRGVSRGGGLTRAKPEPTDLIFGPTQRELLNAILHELKLKFDRDGQRRTAYSLRHTYICFRLMEGADIYQIAKNCRTSVEMIEKYYATHIKNRLDAAAINVLRVKTVNPNVIGALSDDEE